MNLTVIAQERNVLPIWGWSFLLIALLVGLFVVVWWARRRAVRDPGTSPGGAQPFTLSELRAMRDAGDLTPEQYEKLRANLIGAARAGKPVE